MDEPEPKAVEVQQPRTETQQPPREAEEDDLEGERAYVALLHGERYEFFIYASALGKRLKKLDEGTPRVLLVGRALPEQRFDFLEGEGLRCLSAVWQVRPVDMVDAAAADKTSRKRHRYVFTKLRAFEVPYRKIIFFDLDVVVLKTPVELFEVPAPAGMFHGDWSDRREAVHGELLPPQALGLGTGCVNAGLLRLDPPVSKKAREQLVDEMLGEVALLTDEVQSYLPEQYYLVGKLQGWRHIAVSWNCEVNPCEYADNLADKPELHPAQMPRDWFELGDSQEQLSQQVNMFHFSGTYLDPWWYLSFSPEKAHAKLRSQFRERDRRGMIALSIAEWLRSVEELLADPSLEGEPGEHLRSLILWLAWFSEIYWEECAKTCTTCGAEDLTEELLCEECVVRDARNKPTTTKIVGICHLKRPEEVQGGSRLCRTCVPRGSQRSGKLQKRQKSRQTELLDVKSCTTRPHTTLRVLGQRKKQAASTV